MLNGIVGVEPGSDPTKWAEIAKNNGTFGNYWQAGIYNNKDVVRYFDSSIGQLRLLEWTQVSGTESTDISSEITSNKWRDVGRASTSGSGSGDPVLGGELSGTGSAEVMSADAVVGKAIGNVTPAQGAFSLADSIQLTIRKIIYFTSNIASTIRATTIATITPVNLVAANGDSLETLANKFQGQINNISTLKQKSGTVLTFTGSSLYGSEASPEVNNFSASLSGLIIGVPVWSVHNSIVTPTFFSECVVVYGTYKTGINNYICFQALSATRVVVFIYNFNDDVNPYEAGNIGAFGFDGSDILGNNTYNTTITDNAAASTLQGKGNAATAVQATAANQPIKFGDSVKFTTDDFLTVAANSTLNTNVQSWVCVFELTATPTGTNIIFNNQYTSGTSLPAANENFMALAVNASSQLTFSVRNAAGAQISTSGIAVQINRRYITIPTWDGNTISLFLDEMPNPQTATGAIGNPAGHVRVVIGAGYTSAGAVGNYANMRLYALLSYGELLTTRKRNSIKRALKSQYGL